MADHIVLMGHGSLMRCPIRDTFQPRKEGTSIHNGSHPKPCKQTVLKATDNLFATEYTSGSEDTNKLFSFEMEFNDEKMDMPKTVSLTRDWQTRAVSLYQKGTEMKTVESVLDNTTVPAKDFCNFVKILKAGVKPSSKDNQSEIEFSCLKENVKPLCTEHIEDNKVKQQLDDENLRKQKLQSILSKNADNLNISANVLHHEKFDKNNINLVQKKKQTMLNSNAGQKSKDSMNKDTQKSDANDMKMSEPQNEKLSIQHLSSNENHNHDIQKHIQNTTAEKSSTRKLMEHKMQNILITAPWQSDKKLYTRHDYTGNLVMINQHGIIDRIC